MTSQLGSDKKSEVKKMEITINVNDLDISQLTSDVMTLSTEIGNNLMHVFKEAYNKGLKSGYVLGHKEGFEKVQIEFFYSLKILIYLFLSILFNINNGRKNLKIQIKRRIIMEML